jgi:ADP-sugar diphosphatase
MFSNPTVCKCSLLFVRPFKTSSIIIRNMSSTPKPIPLTIPPHLSLTSSQLQSHKPYKTWLSTLQHSLALQSSDPSHAFHKDPYELKKIEVQAVDFFGGERIGFVKLKAEIKNSNGEKLPGSVFLRGGSIGIIVSLIKLALISEDVG